MKKLLVLLALTTSSFAATELTYQVESDITYIVKNRIIDPSFKNTETQKAFIPLIKMLGGEDVDVDAAIRDILEYINSPKVVSSFVPHFVNNFSAEEISELRKIYENDAMLRLENNNEIKIEIGQLFVTLVTDVIPKKVASEKETSEKEASEILELTEATYADVTAHGMVIVDVYAKWCGPCKMMTPIFKELSEEFPSVTFAKVDSDKESKLVKTLGVTGLPTFLLYKDGKKVAKVVGGVGKEALREKIRNAFSL